MRPTSAYTAPRSIRSIARGILTAFALTLRLADTASMDERCGPQSLGFGPRKAPGPQTRGNHFIDSPSSRGALPGGVVQSGTSDDARQEELLFLIQARRRLPEVVPGGRVYTVGARAVVDGVQVELQDLVLGVSSLHPPGE